MSAREKKEVTSCGGVQRSSSSDGGPWSGDGGGAGEGGWGGAR